jgi:hypothetical protein
LQATTKNKEFGYEAEESFECVFEESYSPGFTAWKASLLQLRIGETVYGSEGGEIFGTMEDQIEPDGGCRICHEIVSSKFFVVERWGYCFEPKNRLLNGLRILRACRPCRTLFSKTYHKGPKNIHKDSCSHFGRAPCWWQPLPLLQK